MAINDSIKQQDLEQQQIDQTDLSHTFPSASDFTVGMAGESSDSEDTESLGPVTATDGSDVESLTEEETEEVGSIDQPLEVSANRKVVLVTGGAGFVGSHVADFLLARGDSVIVVDEMNDYYDVNLKRANLEYLTSKYGCTRLKVVEVSTRAWVIGIGPRPSEGIWMSQWHVGGGLMSSRMVWT